MEERIVDLHIHSHYSRATSKEMNIESLYRWAKIKGIDVLGTGDITHPAWFVELQEKLVPSEEGLFQLKKDFAKVQDQHLPDIIRDREVRFILSVEISNIYKRHDHARRLHNLVILPGFEAGSRLINELSKIGNLKSDGRPILGLDSRDLLETTLGIDDRSFFIPAHIWTPWFGMFGFKSGFDTIQEAFGDLADHVVAVETGLSSDPFMNWRLSQLHGITLVSHSDAHSPVKLGREANIIKSELTYDDIIGAIKSNDERFIGTIEFFPEKGKYHMDGHKACGVMFTPEETDRHKGKCPNCRKKVTVGVEHRVNQLADRPVGFVPEKHKKVEYIIPLDEMIAEMEGVKGTKSKTVQNKYEEMVRELGSELVILRKVKISEIENRFPKMSVAIEKMRHGEVVREPGYDGEYGVIKVFAFGDEVKRSFRSS